MEITINEKIYRVRRPISRYLFYNKISNIIYMVNYNLLLNILNEYYFKKFEWLLTWMMRVFWS